LFCFVHEENFFTQKNLAERGFAKGSIYSYVVSYLEAGPTKNPEANHQNRENLQGI